MHIRRILVLASAVVLAACDSTSGPQGVEGRYTLALIDTNDVDAFPPIPDGMSLGGREVVSATLTLRAPDRVLYVMRSHPLDEHGRRQAIETDTVHARYSVQGTDLTFTHVSSTRFRLGELAHVRSHRRLDAVLGTSPPPDRYAVSVGFTR